jgi:hypothetical protein
MTTKLWFNEDGAYAVSGPDGLWVGSERPKKIPEWINRAPDLLLGDPVEWNGGENPLEPGALVLCKLRFGGYYYGTSDPHPALWHHAPAKHRPNPAGDVVSYQVAI